MQHIWPRSVLHRAVEADPDPATIFDSREQAWDCVDWLVSKIRSLERLAQAASVGDIHAAELGLSLEERGAADAMAAADRSRRQTLFLIPQDSDYPVFGKPALLHRPTPLIEAVALYSFLDQFAGLTPSP